MVDIIQPKWPVEQTTLYCVNYYVTNSINEAPLYVYTNMLTYENALQKAKDVITDNNNVGVCTIWVSNAYIVYPASGFVDF